MSNIEIVPTGAALGAEVRGVGVDRGATPEQLAALEAAWREHLVLVLHGQRVSDARLVEFSRRFGALDPPGPNPYGEPFHQEFPELNVISNLVEDGRPLGNLGAGEAVWHADMTYVEHLPKAAILYALEVPLGGGDTWFANMYAACERLPPELGRRVAGRFALHDASHNSAGMLRQGYAQVTDVRRTPGARHGLDLRFTNSALNGEF